MIPARRFLEIGLLIFIIIYTASLIPMVTPQAQELTFCIPSPGKLLEFNPYFYIASPPLTHGTVVKLVYETLAEERADGSLQPLLAINWSVSQDGKTVTIKLRQGISWHDGTPFTSKDVAFVLNTIQKFPQGDVYSIGRYIGSIETPDQATVVIKLKEPFSRFLYYLLTGYRIFPEHVFTNKDMSNFTARDIQYIVGTGPYRVVEANFDSQIFRFAAYEKYWGGQPQIKSIVVRVIDESAPIPIMLKTGQCSMAMITNPALVAPAITDPKLKVAVARGWPYQGSFYTPAGLVVLNTAVYPFNITLFRQALAYAINKERIIQLALQGFGEIASSGQLPLSSPWRPQDLNEITYNISKAREILRSLGFVEGPDKMFRYPNGSLLSIKIIHTGGVASNIVPLIIQDWRAAGIDASEEVLTRLTYVNNLAYGYYQAALLLTNRPTDPDFVLTVFMDRNPAPTPIGQSVQYWGWTRYLNPEFNNYIMMARSAISDAEAYKYYAEAQRIAARDQWVIPLYYAKAIWVFNAADFTGWDPLFAGQGFPSHEATLSVKPYQQQVVTVVTERVVTERAPVVTVTETQRITTVTSVAPPQQTEQPWLLYTLIAAIVVIAIAALAIFRTSMAGRKT